MIRRTEKATARSSATAVKPVEIMTGVANRIGFGNWVSTFSQPPFRSAIESATVGTRRARGSGLSSPLA